MSGVDDFSSRDLEPTRSKRFCFLLSALINFGKFREERLIKFESLTEALQEAMDKTEEAEMENQTLNAELKKYQFCCRCVLCVLSVESTLLTQSCFYFSSNISCCVVCVGAACPFVLWCRGAQSVMTLPLMSLSSISG